MGWFSRRETPITGDVTIVVPLELAGVVRFSLDERADGGMLWDASWMELISDSEVADSLEGNVQMLVNKGVNLLQDKIPSAEVSNLMVKLDDSGAKPEVHVWGETTFLASEWDAIKLEASRGQMYAPKR